MSLKIGLEVEFFLTQNGKIVNVGSQCLPHDEYPLLAEARGDPFDCAFKAVASVRGEIERIVSLAKARSLDPLFTNWVEKDKHVKTLQLAILRAGLHKHIAWENIHGNDVSEKQETHLCAGLHVSFTNSKSFNYDSVTSKTVDGKVVSWNETKTHTYNPLFDVIKLFGNIEKEFGKDIVASERVMGFYEIKSDGRIEYRSLPATLIHTRDFAQRLARCLV